MGWENLSQLPVGSRAQVARLTKDTPVMRRLAEMGLTPGAPVEMIRRAPLSDPVQVRLRGCALTIRLRDAKEVLIVPCAKSLCAATQTAARPR